MRFCRRASRSGHGRGWRRDRLGPLCRSGGTIIGMHSFGGSAPGTDVMTEIRFVADKVLQAAKDQIAQSEIAGKRPMNPLKALQDHRQAMWLDFLSAASSPMAG